MQNKNAFRGFVPVTGNWDLRSADNGGQSRKNKRGCCPVCGQNPCRCARGERPCAAENAANICVREAEAAVCAVRTGDCCDYTDKQRKSCTCQQEYPEPRRACGCKGKCTCEKEQSGQAEYAPAKPCACQQEYAEPCNAQMPRRDRCAGMVEVQEQELGEIYRNESALRAGTLFPDLHKPMNGYWPCEENCGTPCQAAAFAAWELRLYLDTHPDDCRAMALLAQIEERMGDPNYATTFLPEDNGQNWTWVNEPWPWNFDCSCGN